MKKLVCIAMLALGAAAVAQNSTSQSSQSLGDVARKSRAEDKGQAKKVYTNDDFAQQPAAAPAPAAEAKSADSAPSAEEATKTPSPREKAQDSVDLSKETGATSGEAKDKNSAAPKDKDPKDAKAAEDEQAKVDAEWKSKIDDQKKKIASLQREYDLTDREYKLFATTFYADAGNRLRDQKDFHDQEASYRDKIGTLKQQINDEQSKLAELQEQAHKAGANKAYE